MKRTAKLSAAQLSYIAAKARVDVLIDAVHAAMAEHEHLAARPCNEANLKRYCEISVETEDALGLTAAWDALHAAEDALLEWGQAAVRDNSKTRAQYAERADELDSLFALAINWKSYKARTGLIDITMRLAA